MIKIIFFTVFFGGLQNSLAADRDDFLNSVPRIKAPAPKCPRPQFNAQPDAPRHQPSKDHEPVTAKPKAAKRKYSP